ncbi:LamG-like jellyroll fold domain-containing protein [Haloferula sp. A504]|uniref:LamG-like jellyroll fold domain-containing protein n=1 Tax=Haloferula sp. A504 TaxID=3373601 RepID=UPI0031C2144A|nr:fibronectin type III domain-containing protein [Verrucomicrobiaceae bacterium E54]
MNPTEVEASSGSAVEMLNPPAGSTITGTFDFIVETDDNAIRVRLMDDEGGFSGFSSDYTELPNGRRRFTFAVDTIARWSSSLQSVVTKQLYVEARQDPALGLPFDQSWKASAGRAVSIDNRHVETTSAHLFMASNLLAPGVGGATWIQFGGRSQEGTPFFGMRPGGGNETLTITHGATNIRDGRWHHVAGVRRGNTVEIWVDGVLDGSVTNANLGSVNLEDVDSYGQQDPTVPIYIGYQPSYTGTEFVGSMDDLIVFKRALSSSEIDSMVATGIGAPSPPNITNILLTQLTSNSLSFTWGATFPDDPGRSTAGLAYELEYRALGDEAWIGASPATTSIQLSGLASFTPYEVRIRAINGGQTGGWSLSSPHVTGTEVVYENEECIVYQGPRGGFDYPDQLLEEALGFATEEMVSDLVSDLIDINGIPLFYDLFITAAVKFVNAALSAGDPKFYPFIMHPDIQLRGLDIPLLGTIEGTMFAPEWEPLQLGMLIEMRDQGNSLISDIEFVHYNFFWPIEHRILVPQGEVHRLAPGNNYILLIKQQVGLQPVDFWSNINSVYIFSDAALEVDAELVFDIIRSPRGTIIGNYRGDLSDGGRFSVLGMDNGKAFIMLEPFGGGIKTWRDVAVSEDGTFVVEGPWIVLGLPEYVLSGAFSSTGDNIQVDLLYESAYDLPISGQALAASPSGSHDSSAGLFQREVNLLALRQMQDAWVAGGSDGFAHVVITTNEGTISEVVAVAADGSFSFVTEQGETVLGAVVDGSYSISILDTEGGSQGLSVAKVNPEGSYAAWQGDAFGSIPLSLRGPEEDPDMDGRVNLLEFLEGTDPGVADVSGGASLAISGQTPEDRFFEYKHALRADLVGVDYWVEESRDGSIWSTVPEERISRTEGDGTLILRAVDPVANESGMMRVRAELAE